MLRISTLRRSRKITQVKLAVMADIDPATLNRIEQNKGNPNLLTLKRLAEALHVHITDLFVPKGQK